MAKPIWAFREQPFIINADGKIGQVWPKVKVAGHAKMFLIICALEVDLSITKS